MTAAPLVTSSVLFLVVSRPPSQLQDLALQLLTNGHHGRILVLQGLCAMCVCL